ncbi:MOSC domain protein [Beggiatoa sp. PS]|nr:MOSC domain protein [Beggiatoa sp. PS]
MYFDEASPFVESDWIDKELKLGSAIVRGVRLIKRCAATNVNPETATRDMELPQTLIDTYGHPNLGIYVRVIEDGEVALNNHFELIS